MASRNELYAKFGLTAEAAQIFEADLGVMLLAFEGWQNSWHTSIDRGALLEFIERLNRKTLGQRLNALKRQFDLDDLVVDKLERGLVARNWLNHEFFWRHRLAIETDEGRDEMIQVLDSLHSQLDEAWNFSQQVAVLLASGIGDSSSNVE